MRKVVAMEKLRFRMIKRKIRGKSTLIKRWGGEEISEKHEIEKCQQCGVVKGVCECIPESRSISCVVYLNQENAECPAVYSRQWGTIGGMNRWVKEC